LSGANDFARVREQVDRIFFDSDNDRDF